MTATALNSRPQAGDQFGIMGRAPRRALVVVQEKRAGRWVEIGSDRALRSNGDFEVTYRIKSPGRHLFRAVSGGSMSPVVPVTVTPRIPATLKTLTSTTPKRLGALLSATSPDFSTIVFGQYAGMYEDRFRGRWVLDVDTGEAEELPLPRQAQVCSVSDDGRYVLFVQYWASVFDRVTGTTVTAPNPDPDLYWDANCGTFDHTGTKVAFGSDLSNGDSAVHLWDLNADTVKIAQIPSAGRPQKGAWAVHISADGESIVYSGYDCEVRPDGECGEDATTFVALIPVETMEARYLTPRVVGNIWPAVSRDNHYLAYARDFQESPRTKDISTAYLVDLQTGKRIQFDSGKYKYLPIFAVSNAGDVLYMEEWHSDRALSMYRPAEGYSTTLKWSTTRDFYNDGLLSPDGRRVLIATKNRLVPGENDGNRSDLYLWERR